jgi:hypothetical protein
MVGSGCLVCFDITLRPLCSIGTAGLLVSAPSKRVGTVDSDGIDGGTFWL